ncbi:PPE family protein [Mycobacterium gordonae]|uniref:PPE family protein n=1 Tax=Mycobacterium gordonae TaxID=1778 RepID=UPI00210DD84E|nr:PPE family protein [Mycobacterium gordonae]MCQ4361958.1 PPE family protein [Mycobacterium gordonae]
MTSANYAVLPPEINSARIFAGAGPAPMLAAAIAWEELADELRGAAAAFGSATVGLLSDAWRGAGASAMATAATPYLGWLTTSAEQAQEAARLARGAASEFEAVLAATVHPELVAANRAQLFSLVATNLFGHNAPAIAAIEAGYEEFWAQDASAMAAYHAGASEVVAQLSGWPQRLADTLGAGIPLAAGSVQQGAGSVTANAAAAQTVAEVMGYTGIPMPGPLFVDLANTLYIQRSVPGAVARALITPESLYPITGVRNLTFDPSVAQGVAILHSAVTQQLADGNNVHVFGFSQSATIASLEMSRLAASVAPPTPAQVSFTLLGNPSNPNGGIATRFPGVSLPAFGVSSSAPTPDNLYPTKIYTLEYDGIADFPRYPLNVLSVLNAVLGANYVHPNYLFLTPEQIDAAIPLTNTVGPTMTEYYMIRTENLPLLEPLRAIPVLGEPLADLIQPNLRVIVNLGYGDPNYGYSTAPPNVATPFGLFPEVDPQTLVTAFAAGTQQGIGDFAHDLAHLRLQSPDLPNLLAPSPTSSSNTGTGTGPVSPAVSIDNLIDGFQVTGTKVGNAITKVAAVSYGTLLPTADVINTLVTTAPFYNINLFVDGIQQVLHGDPMGLINAIGYPIAADVALVAIAGGVEILVFISAGDQIARALSGLGL